MEEKFMFPVLYAGTVSDTLSYDNRLNRSFLCLYSVSRLNLQACTTDLEKIEFYRMENKISVTIFAFKKQTAR